MYFTKDKLIEQIKCIGHGLINNAENMVTELENKSNVYISISFTPDNLPSISVSTDFIPQTLIEYYKNNS